VQWKKDELDDAAAAKKLIDACGARVNAAVDFSGATSSIVRLVGATQTVSAIVASFLYVQHIVDKNCVIFH
jgi:hypothetical protein